jgi:5-methylcytosine-specific restriction enzyme A
MKLQMHSPNRVPEADLARAKLRRTDSLRFADAGRGTKQERGYGGPWEKTIRPYVLRRDGFTCRCDECARLGRVLPATEVDHVVPKFEGGGDGVSNLAAINVDCHRRKTQAEAERARMGAGEVGGGSKVQTDLPRRTAAPPDRGFFSSASKT